MVEIGEVVDSGDEFGVGVGIFGGIGLIAPAEGAPITEPEGSGGDVTVDGDFEECFDDIFIFGENNQGSTSQASAIVTQLSQPTTSR